MERDVAQVCREVVDLMGRLDEDVLLEALADDTELAAGLMYARAANRGLVELHEAGAEKVQRALITLAELAEEE